MLQAVAAFPLVDRIITLAVLVAALGGALVYRYSWARAGKGEDLGGKTLGVKMMAIDNRTLAVVAQELDRNTTALQRKIDALQQNTETLDDLKDVLQKLSRTSTAIFRLLESEAEHREPKP